MPDADSIATRLDIVAQTEESVRSAAAAVAEATSNLASVRSIQDAALLAANSAAMQAHSTLATAMQGVTSGLAAIGHPVQIPNGDGTSSLVELHPPGYRVLGPFTDGTAALPG